MRKEAGVVGEAQISVGSDNSRQEKKEGGAWA